MSIATGYVNLAENISAQLTLPAISSLYLPELSETDDFRDEFGLLFLDDGIVAPFYTSLPGVLQELRQLYPPEKPVRNSLIELIRMFPEPNPARKAIALGAFNAMSQWLMKRAGLFPLTDGNGSNMGSAKPHRGERVGMIGYFCPLIDKLLAAGNEVLVIERQPERVEVRTGLVLSQNPAELASCRLVLCTAATLVNDSIDDILCHCQQAENVSLIGPSGSGLPDLLFERGIHAVGGVYFPDEKELSTRLRARESWGSSGHKYQLTPNIYPGYRELLSRVAAA